jgi:outer membrane protein, adhesin transport system
MSIPRFGAALAVLCGALATPSGVHAETLGDAVVRALDWHPELRESEAGRRAVEEQVAQARSGYLPSIDAALGRGREHSENASTRPGDLSLPRAEAEITLSQMLFDGGAVSIQVRRSQARSEGAAQQVAQTAESIALRTVQAYLEVLRTRELARIADENTASHARTLEQVRTLAQSGVGRMADVQQAAARLAQADAAASFAKGQLDQAVAGYRHVVGRGPGALERPALGPNAAPPNVEAAIERAFNHAAVRAAQKEREAAHAERAFSRTRFAPRVSLDLGINHNRDIDGVRGLAAERIAMLRLRHNLYRGGSDEARVREAEARVDEADAGLARVLNEIERDVRQSYDALRVQRERLPALEAHAAASAAVVASYRAQFRIGQRSLLDLLNSEAEQFSAQGNLVTGQYAMLAAAYRLHASTGRLLETLGIAR